MGQGKSSLNSDAPLYNINDFNEQPKTNDSRYGNVQPLIHKQTGAQFVVVTKTIQDEQEATERLSELEIRERLQHPNLVSLVRKNSKKQNDFCSTFYEIGLLYEYWAGNLKSEFAERRYLGVGY